MKIVGVACRGERDVIVDMTIGDRTLTAKVQEPIPHTLSYQLDSTDLSTIEYAAKNVVNEACNEAGCAGGVKCFLKRTVKVKL